MAHLWEAVKRSDMPGVGPGFRLMSAVCERCRHMRMTTVLLDAPTAASIVLYVDLDKGPLPRGATEPLCVPAVPHPEGK